MFNALIKMLGLDGPLRAPPKRRRLEPARPAVAPVVQAPPPPFDLAKAKAALKVIHEQGPYNLSTAVRWLMWDAAGVEGRKAMAGRNFTGRSNPRKSAHDALGAERLSYLRLLMLLRKPLPTLPPDVEGTQPAEEIYRRRLDTDVLEDVATWRAGLAIYDRQVSDAERDGVEPPAAMVIPDEVEKAIAAQVAEELARIRRGRGGGGGAGGAAGLEPATPKDDDPPAGPKK